MDIKRLVLLVLAVGVITGSGALIGWQFFPGSPHQPAIASAIESLSSCDYEASDEAAETLKQLSSESVPYLARALARHETVWSRYLARVPFIPRARNVAATRERAAEQLALIAPHDPRAIHALIRALRDENPEVQRALRKIGPSEHLTAALHDGDPRIRRGVAEVLGDLGPRAIASAPALTYALHDKDESVRAGVAYALGAVGAPSAITPLIAALNDPAASVRTGAAESLGRIRARRGLLALMQKLSDPDTGVRVKVAQAIWRIDGDAERTVPVLVRALRDRHAASAAKFVLGEIGVAAKEAVPALVQSLREERVGRALRTPPSSALALGRIGAPAVPELIPVLENDNPEVRTSAVIALGFIGKPAHDAVPHLMPLLHDNNLEVRQAAALALGSIAPDNRELIPALKQLARDDDIFLASAASAMLRNLDPAAAIELGLE